MFAKAPGGATGPRMACAGLRAVLEACAAAHAPSATPRDVAPGACCELLDALAASNCTAAPTEEAACLPGGHALPPAAPEVLPPAPVSVEVGGVAVLTEEEKLGLLLLRLQEARNAADDDTPVGPGVPVRALSILVVTVTLVGGLVVALMLGMFLRGARRRVQAFRASLREGGASPRGRSRLWRSTSGSSTESSSSGG